MILPFMFGIWVGIDVDQAGILRDFITATHYSVYRVRWLIRAWLSLQQAAEQHY